MSSCCPALPLSLLQVAQVAWRLSAASRFSSEPDQQRAEQELRWAFEDEEAVARLAELVQAVDVVEEAQVGRRRASWLGMKSSWQQRQCLASSAVHAQCAQRPKLLADPSLACHALHGSLMLPNDS